MPSLSPSDLLLDRLSVGLCEQVQHGATEVVGVTVGISQLIGNCVQEKVPACRRGTVSTYRFPYTQKEIKKQLVLLKIKGL